MRSTAVTSGETAAATTWPEGFENFYRQRYPWAVRLAHMVLGRHDMAHDIAQDVFVAVARHWDSVDAPVPYTRRAIVNAAVRAKRRTRRERELAVGERPEVVPPPELVEPLQALDRLSPRRRAVLVMRFYEDLPDEDIAAALGCTRSTVRSLAHRALRQIAKEMS